MTSLAGSKDTQSLRRRVAIGSNPERNRAHNRRVVLEVIRSHGHLGRTEIARHAHLSAQAVTNIVDELLEDGMLIELGRLRAGRGQPPIQFAVNPDGPLDGRRRNRCRSHGDGSARSRRRHARPTDSAIG